MGFILERDFVYSDLNFVTRERLDPLLLSVAQLLSESALAYLFLQFVIAGGGAYLLFRFLKWPKETAIFRALFFVIASVLVVGLDPVGWRVHWFPVLLFSYFVSLTRITIGLPLLVFSLAVWVLVAGSASIFGILFALLVSLLIQEEICNGHLVVIVSAIALGIAYFTLPMYSFPDYPAGAQLVPLSGIQANPRPLFGPYYHVRTIVEAVYRTSLYQKGMIAAACVLIVFFSTVFNVVSVRKFSRSLVFLILSIGLIVTFISSELLLFNELGEYGLFATLSRFIPGLALSSLPWVYFPLLFLVFLIFLPPSVNRKSNSVASAFFVMLLVGLPFLKPGILSLDDGVKHFIGTANKDELRISSSKYVIDYWGDWVLDSTVGQQRDFSRVKWLREGVDYAAQYFAEPMPEEAWKAGDGSQNTRWRTARPQAKGDFFEARFDRTLEIIKIVLSIQKTPSDFPRGVLLEVTDENGNTSSVFEKENWVGPVKWTPKGYPYFGAQSEVIIELPELMNVKGIKVTQIANDPRYDWSIGELKLFSLQ